MPSTERSLSAGTTNGPGERAVIAFERPPVAGLPWEDARSGLVQSGFHRLWVEGQTVDVGSLERAPAEVIVVVDRLVLRDDSRGRILSSLEQAFQFGRGKLVALLPGAGARDQGPGAREEKEADGGQRTAKRERPLLEVVRAADP